MRELAWENWDKRNYKLVLHPTLVNGEMKNAVGWKSDIGTSFRKTDLKERYIVPDWCKMPLEEHVCAWGCMGIQAGYVSVQGRYYRPDVREVELVSSSLLNNEDDFMSFRYSHESANHWDTCPVRFPCFVLLYRWSQADRWGDLTFHQISEYQYET